MLGWLSYYYTLLNTTRKGCFFFATPLGINILDVNEYYEGEECYYSSYTDTSYPNNTNGNSVSSSFSHISKLGISTYKDPKNSCELIRKDNNNKVGVYC